MSIFVVTPNSFSKSLKTSGSSYSAQWKKLSLSSISPPAEGLPPPPGSGLSSPQAASSTLLENTATAEPARKCRLVIRSTVAREARTFTPSNSSVIGSPYPSVPVAAGSARTTSACPASNTWT